MAYLWTSTSLKARCSALVGRSLVLARLAPWFYDTLFFIGNLINKMCERCFVPLLCIFFGSVVQLHCDSIRDIPISRNEYFLFTYLSLRFWYISTPFIKTFLSTVLRCWWVFEGLLVGTRLTRSATVYSVLHGDCLHCPGYGATRLSAQVHCGHPCSLSSMCVVRGTGYCRELFSVLP